MAEENTQVASTSSPSTQINTVLNQATEKPKKDTLKSAKRKRQDLNDILASNEDPRFKAELYLTRYGNKVISKLINQGTFGTTLYRAIKELASAKGNELGLEKIALDFYAFLPILRILHDIGLDVTHTDNQLLRLAVKGRHYESVRFLLKHGADPNAQGGQAFVESFMPSGQEPDMHMFYILMEATKSLKYIPDKLLNRIIRDKNYGALESMLAKSKAADISNLSATLKKVIDTKEPDWTVITTFAIHQPEMVETFKNVIFSKPWLLKQPSLFALFLDQNIYPTVTDKMLEDMDPYCQFMIGNDRI